MEPRKAEFVWTHIDQTSDPATCVRYLDTISGTEGGQAYKRQVLAHLNIHEGDHVLDVGCGTGDDTRIIAGLVGNTGRVVGVDNSATMIAEARKRAAGLGLPVEYQVGDAHRLDFADNTFDRCRADRIFQHLEEPRRALHELKRVARSGAMIVVADPDWETFVVDSPDWQLTRKILDFRRDHVRNGRIGRHLFALFREADLADITLSPVSFASTNYALIDQLGGLRESAKGLEQAGGAFVTEVDSWLGHLEEAGQVGRFLGAIMLFIVAGRKP